MGETLYLILAFVVGMGLGVFFSMNLWSSVKKMVDEHSSWYVVVGNFVLRMSVVILGFVLTMRGRWECAFATLLGFVLMREIMVHRLGRKPRVS